MKTSPSKTYETQQKKKKSFKRKVYSNSILPQKTRKTPNKQSNLIPEATRERSKNKTQKVSRRKEIIKIRAEINEIEKTVEKINETKS